MSDPAAELAFQNEISAYLTAHDWLLGSSAAYDRERALYPEDVIGYAESEQRDAKGRNSPATASRNSARKTSGCRKATVTAPSPPAQNSAPALPATRSWRHSRRSSPA